MAELIQHRVNLKLRRDGRVDRRDWLKTLAAGAVGGLSLRDWIGLQAAELRRQGMACILLWMQGGPSQFETFSPKSGPTGGETRAIATSVPGIEIAETLPETAQVMDQLCLIRSMTSKEGSHPRASYLLHTGYLPTANVKYPALGAHLAHQAGTVDGELPDFVRIGRVRSGSGGGLLGVDYDPFVLEKATSKPENTAVSTPERRFRKRMQVLGRLEQLQAEGEIRREVEDHRKLYDKSARMILSPRMDVFDLSRVAERERAAYGDSEFAAGCLLARRLVETGVTFVEVAAGNWDTHTDNAERTRELCGQVDRPFAQLVRDLQQRGMLERTLVIWMGEFGRTPRINPRGGRDHFPRAFNLALAGGGVKGGQVIGSTDASGSEVADRPVTVPDLFRTFCHVLNLDADRENVSVNRPIPVVTGGEIIREVLG